jgi:hypothetical protein
MSLVSLFVIDEGMAKFYEATIPHFGQGVSDKFPSANYDIEEAASALRFVGQQLV